MLRKGKNRFGDCHMQLTLCSANLQIKVDSTNIFLFKVNNKYTRKRCQIYLKSAIQTPERRHCRRSGILIFHIFHNLS